MKDQELARRKVGGKVFQERKECVAGMWRRGCLLGEQTEALQKGGVCCTEPAPEDE